MTKFQYLLSAATIAIGSLVGNAAYADCAGDLAALSADMDMTASIDGAKSGQTETMAGDTAAAKDQAAAAGQGKTFTQEGGGASSMSVDPAQSTKSASGKPDATGAVSGIAPTAALGKVAQGETGKATTKPGSGGAAATATGAEVKSMAGATPGGGEQMAMQHVAAAQAALSKGDEAGCAAAVQQARQSMGN